MPDLKELGKTAPRPGLFHPSENPYRKINLTKYLNRDVRLFPFPLIKNLKKYYESASAMPYAC